MKKNESKPAGQPKTASDAKRNTPIHHLIIGGLARFWFLALIPPLMVVFPTGNLIFGLIAAFAVNFAAFVSVESRAAVLGVTAALSTGAGAAFWRSGRFC